ncbi:MULTISPECIES: hypothetical protein [Aeromonas]|uniref:hypothetical protein n=1 Tax=Aeromonas TaxID=642 RepID=UPI001BFCB1BA|nr:hypothetical protein [Aeromonas dhakensis]HEB4978138.1 hypothetical protein [Aeromonas dhakensis]
MSNQNTLNIDDVRHKYEEEFKLGLIGTFGFLFTAVIPLILIDKEWFKPHIHVCFFSGITLLLVYIATFFERSPFFSALWKYHSVKFAISIAFSLLVFSSNYRASATINSVFGVDASVFPYTQVALTFLNAAVTLEVVIRWLFLYSLLILASRAWAYRGQNRHGWIAFLLGAGYLFSSVTGWFFTSRYFDNEEDMNVKAYAIAHRVDFSTKHLCSNIDGHHKIIFLGPQMNRVLVDAPLKNNLSIYDTLKLKNTPDSEIKESKSLYITECDKKEM